MDEKEIPYTHPKDAPYNWVRVRLLGGRSLFWARQSFRLSDYEFKAADIDGTGDNWPISHADLAPYYSRVEKIFRVTGRKEGWPQFPDGNFVEANFPPDTESIKAVTAIAQEARHRRLEVAQRRAETVSPARSTCCCRTRSRRASWTSYRTPSCAKLASTRTQGWQTARTSSIVIPAAKCT